MVVCYGVAVALLTSGSGCHTSSGFRRHPLPRRHTERTYNGQPPAVAPSPPAETPAPLPPNPDNAVEPAPPPTPLPVPPPVERSTAAPATPDPGSAKLRSLYQQAAERYATLPAYTAHLKRREQINGTNKPEEVILFKFRREPWSVYFQWLGPEGQGREVVFVKGRHNGMLHTRLAKGDMPLMPAGRVMSLMPDNPFVVASSRHVITEAGLGTMIDQFGRLVAERDGHALRYAGSVRRAEFPHAVEAVEQTIPPGSEKQLPKGGTRQWYFDPASRLPLLLITYDASGHEVEYYCYENLQAPVAFSDDDFNPEKLWKKPGR